MIKYRWYRWVQVVFGARSFVKKTSESTSYALVKGKPINTEQVIGYMEADGFVEEWVHGAT